MTCHYSCQTCSSSTYLNFCTSCPITRILEGTSCACDSNYYQYQTTSCVQSSQINSLDSTLIQISDIAFYFSIFLFWFAAFMNMNRVFSIKVKRLIDTGQLISLIMYYRYIHSEVSQRALKVLGAYNFTYLNQILCTASGPPQQCQFYQNLIGPGIAFSFFLSLYFISFVVALCWLKVQFSTYFTVTFWGILYIYMDFTIIGNTLALIKLISVSYWAFFILGGFLILLLIILRKHYLIINNKRQTLLQYRLRNSFLYSYDQFYHLNYIDFLYQVQQQLKELKNLKQKQKGVIAVSENSMSISDRKNSKNISQQQNRNTLTLVRINESKYVKGNKLVTSTISRTSNKQNWVTQQDSKVPQFVKFFPRSNFLLFQLIYKCATATSIILLYQYKPSLFAYLLAIALIFQLIYLGVFFVYQRFDLLFYFLMIILYLGNISTYMIQSTYYNIISFTTMAIIQVLLSIYCIVMLITGYQTRRVHQKIYQQKNLDAKQQQEEDALSAFQKNLLQQRISQKQYDEEDSSDQTIQIQNGKKSKQSKNKTKSINNKKVQQQQLILNQKNPNHKRKISGSLQLQQSKSLNSLRDPSQNNINNLNNLNNPIYDTLKSRTIRSNRVSNSNAFLNNRLQNRQMSRQKLKSQTQKEMSNKNLIQQQKQQPIQQSNIFKQSQQSKHSRYSQRTQSNKLSYQNNNQNQNQQQQSKSRFSQVSKISKESKSNQALTNHGLVKIQQQDGVQYQINRQSQQKKYIKQRQQQSQEQQQQKSQNQLLGYHQQTQQSKKSMQSKQSKQSKQRSKRDFSKRSKSNNTFGNFNKQFNNNNNKDIDNKNQDNNINN